MGRAALCHDQLVRPDRLTPLAAAGSVPGVSPDRPPPPYDVVPLVRSATRAESIRFAPQPPPSRLVAEHGLSRHNTLPDACAVMPLPAFAALGEAPAGAVEARKRAATEDIAVARAAKRIALDPSVGGAFGEELPRSCKRQASEPLVVAAAPAASSASKTRAPLEVKGSIAGGPLAGAVAAARDGARGRRGVAASHRNSDPTASNKAAALRPALQLLQDVKRSSATRAASHGGAGSNDALRPVRMPERVLEEHVRDTPWSWALPLALSSPPKRRHVQHLVPQEQTDPQLQLQLQQPKKNGGAFEAPEAALRGRSRHAERGGVLPQSAAHDDCVPTGGPRPLGIHGAHGSFMQPAPGGATESQPATVGMVQPATVPSTSSTMALSSVAQFKTSPPGLVESSGRLGHGPNSHAPTAEEASSALRACSKQPVFAARVGKAGTTPNVDASLLRARPAQEGSRPEAAFLRALERRIDAIGRKGRCNSAPPPAGGEGLPGAQREALSSLHPAAGGAAKPHPAVVARVLPDLPPCAAPATIVAGAADSQVTVGPAGPAVGSNPKGTDHEPIQVAQVPLRNPLPAEPGAAAESAAAAADTAAVAPAAAPAAPAPPAVPIPPAAARPPVAAKALADGGRRDHAQEILMDTAAASPAGEQQACSDTGSKAMGSAGEQPGHQQGPDPAVKFQRLPPLVADESSAAAAFGHGLPEHAAAALTATQNRVVPTTCREGGDIPTIAAGGHGRSPARSRSRSRRRRRKSRGEAALEAALAAVVALPTSLTTAATPAAAASAASAAAAAAAAAAATAPAAAAESAAAVARSLRHIPQRLPSLVPLEDPPSADAPEDVKNFDGDDASAEGTGQVEGLAAAASAPPAGLGTRFANLGSRLLPWAGGA